MKYFFLTLLFVLSIQFLFGEGTDEVMPNTSDGTALLVKPDYGYGSYRGCPADNRIYFRVKDHTTENFYFGLRKRMRIPSLGVPTNVYYRILNPSGTVVAGPTAVPASGTGYISTYAQAVAGPNIGGATPSGYTPITYNPSVNGEFWIELYRSNDGGNTVDNSTNGEVYFMYFDFQVATSTNIQYDGRVHSKAWSFITYDPVTTNFPPAIDFSFQGTYYGYTADSAVNKVEFADGFQPLGFKLQMNYEGIGNTGNFDDDRKSVYTGVTTPTIVNSYEVFLNIPDTSVYKVAVAASEPVITGNIFGCEGDYYIPYYIDLPGDVAMLLDINGTSGYQSGTTDRVLQGYAMSAGNNVMQWDGLDGQGNPVTTGVTISVTADIYRGRTNIPIYDAEHNINGLTVTSIYPNTGSRQLYWDDSNVGDYGACGSGDDNENNTTGTGVSVTNFYEGQYGPAHTWNGPNPPISGSADPNGGGSSTGQTCDDFGNARTLNTWFWADNVVSTPVTKTVPTCSSEGGMTILDDIDDDNDGITDLVECGGVDPDADADNDGIPNYIDPSYPGFSDNNYDGVNDAFDADRDGVINSKDRDSDNDGFYDVYEAGGTDTDNDGIVDSYVDLNHNGLSDQYDTFCDGSTISGTGGSNAGTSGTVTNPANIIDANNTTYGILDNSNSYIEVGLSQTLEQGATITIRARYDDSNNSGFVVLTSEDDNTYMHQRSYTATSSTTNFTYNVQATTNYVRIQRTGGYDIRLYHVTYSYTVPCSGGVAITNGDSDADGVKDIYDLDNDNDGIPDIVEAGGVDTDGDGRIDATADTDDDGIMDPYDYDCLSRSQTDSYSNTVNSRVGTITNESNTVDASSTTYGVIGDNESIDLDLVTTIPSGSMVEVRLSSASLNSNSTTDIYGSPDDASYTLLGTYVTSSQPTTGNGITYIVTSNTRYIRVSRIGQTDANVRLHIVEFSYETTSSCTDGDLISDYDTDGDGVKNRYDLDSDNDGIPDVVEALGTDANNDGKIDGYSDADGDGFSNNVDGDADNNGTAENTANALIITGTDSNSDGIPNSYPRANNDKSGNPNPYDLDADGDGILDTREAGLQDSDNNGIADGTLGGDGWSDVIDALSSLNIPNSDGHGNYNFLDIDSDNDGIPDNIEGQTTVGYITPTGLDSDGDGHDNAYDNNDGSYAGSSNNGVTPTDTEFDGLPDYIDLDSDDDDFDDRNEGWDTDGNGYIDGGEIAYVGTTDTDQDGLLDEYDADNSNHNPTNNTDPTDYPDERQPAGFDRDWREEDDEGQVLPVSLYAQSVELVESDALVLWSTSSEINNNYFKIERSSDGITFETIGTVKGAGNSNSLRTYQFIDVEPFEGVSYYRISQVDFDGRFVTYPVMSLNNSNSSLMVYPNPAKDVIGIHITENADYEIFGIDGVLVQTGQLNSGNNVIDLNHISSGTYLVKITSSNQTKVVRLIVE